jgi:hypothetical protein
VRNDGLPCDCCLVELPLCVLTKCPVTGAIICLSCQAQPDAAEWEDEDPGSGDGVDTWRLEP